MASYARAVFFAGYLILTLYGPCVYAETCSESGGYSYYCEGRYRCCGATTCCLNPALSRGAITGYVFAGIVGLGLLIALCVGMCHVCGKLKDKLQQKMKKTPTITPSSTTNTDNSVDRITA